MIELLKEPWPWYIAGPLIAVVYTILALFGKSFGISASLRAACSMAGAGKNIPFFDFDWKSQIWNFMFIIGSMIGGFIAVTFLSTDAPMLLSDSTIEALEGLNMTSYQTGIFPSELLSWDALFTAKGFIFMVIGGLLIGFGSRWAGGCTSGHAISGLANLQLPSLIAVIGFFIGGLFMTFILIPIIFNL